MSLLTPTLTQQVHARATRLYDIAYRDGDLECRVPRERIIFLSRPQVVDIDMVVEDVPPSNPISDLTHDDVMDPEMGELLDFTQDVKC